MTDTDATFLFSSNIVGHTHMYVMTLTRLPSIPASLQTLGRVECAVAVHPLLRIEDHQSHIHTRCRNEPQGSCPWRPPRGGAREVLCTCASGALCGVLVPLLAVVPLLAAAGAAAWWRLCSAKVTGMILSTQRGQVQSGRSHVSRPSIAAAGPLSLFLSFCLRLSATS